MLPELEQLLVIQDRDRDIIQLRAEQLRIPEELEELQAKLDDETSTLEAMKQKAKQVEADLKKLELDAATQRQLIAKYKTQQSQVKKNEEYQALTHEIDRTEATIREIEDHELDVMETLEQVQNEARAEQTRLSELTSLSAQKKADLMKRASVIDEQLAKLQAEREGLATKVDSALLHRYQRILDKRRDCAIVRVEHESCGGCHLKLTPQTIHTAKNGRELASCEFCGRLLFWPPS